MRPIQIWPVIHLLDEAQALKNATLAMDAGADGVFLIQMQGWDELIDPVAEKIRIAHPRLALGVNYLSLDGASALRRSLERGWDATWSDNPGVRSDHTSSVAHDIGELLTQQREHMYFGSVAFKYQPLDPNPGEAARIATSFGMIPTTSGDATGQAPTVEKLTSIKSTAGVDRLAVASGITPENLGELGPYLTHALVATGIELDFYTFCPNRLDALMKSSNT